MTKKVIRLVSSDVYIDAEKLPVVICRLQYLLEENYRQQRYQQYQELKKEFEGENK